MFGKFSEQFKQSSKPVNSWMAMNAKLMEDLSQNQTELFTGLLSDSVKYIETVSVQTGVKGVFAANSELAEAMRDRFAVASKGAYSTLSHVQTEMKDVVKSSIEDTAVAAKEVTREVTKAAEKPAPAAKPTAAKKPAAKAAPKAPEKAAPAAAKETPAPAAPEEVKASEAKPAAKTAAKRSTGTRKTTSTAKKPASTKAAATKSTN
ncbi:phasin family protein [Alteromonas gilva]|uniref:Phasin family protein n=1 Tax=Alteromonas gilva TaxID=2987522 RepID=A0ABT5L883_9ALTE|nr:phasin family protein [Alteromonas gilva]MDC8832087.1 phasin family protein [Alteromonas gilva]